MIRSRHEAVTQAGIVVQAVDRQGNAHGVGARQPLARQRRPHGGISETAGVARRYRKSTDMYMIAMGARQAHQRHLAAGIVAQARGWIFGQHLRQRQDAQLQLIGLQGVGFRQHRSLLASRLQRLCCTLGPTEPNEKGRREAGPKFRVVRYA